MEKANTGILKIYFIDGSEMQFEYAHEGEANTMASRIEKAIEPRHLLIELEDRVIGIPVDSIKYFEVTPAPPKLPRTTIRNARLIVN